MIATIFMFCSLLWEPEEPEYLNAAKFLSTRDANGYPLEGIDEVG